MADEFSPTGLVSTMLDIYDRPRKSFEECKAEDHLHDYDLEILRSPTFPPVVDGVILHGCGTDRKGGAWLDVEFRYRVRAEAMAIGCLHRECFEAGLPQDAPEREEYRERRKSLVRDALVIYGEVAKDCEVPVRNEWRAK